MFSSYSQTPAPPLLPILKTHPSREGIYRELVFHLEKSRLKTWIFQILDVHHGPASEFPSVLVSLSVAWAQSTHLINLVGRVHGMRYTE